MRHDLRHRSEMRNSHPTLGADGEYFLTSVRHTSKLERLEDGRRGTVGMEVIVSFIDGDPDRPIITGCIHNGNNHPPDILPFRATKSVIRTRTIPHGPGYNELSFEDAMGMEEIYLKAQPAGAPSALPGERARVPGLGVRHRPGLHSWRAGRRRRGRALPTPRAPGRRDVDVRGADGAGLPLLRNRARERRRRER